jgi:hypothetical protein
VANTGLLLVATLSARSGIAAIVNSTLRMAGLIGGAHPGREELTLVHSIAAGRSHIDHAEVLRAGDTAPTSNAPFDLVFRESGSRRTRTRG